MENIMVTVSGPDKSGKGYVIAAIAHALENFGVNVQVQGSETHNKAKLEKTDEEISTKLSEKVVYVIEQQT